MKCIYNPDLIAENETNDNFKLDSSFEINHLYFQRHALFARCSVS